MSTATGIDSAIFADLRAIIDVPLIIVDHLGMVREVNDCFCETWRWPQKDIVGKPLVSIIPEPFRTAHHLGFSRFLITGRGSILDQPLALPILDGTGAVRQAEICISAQAAGNTWVFAALLHPLESTR
jgi:PAS domain S-box-containing protein